LLEDYIIALVDEDYEKFDRVSTGNTDTSRGENHFYRLRELTDDDDATIEFRRSFSVQDLRTKTVKEWVITRVSGLLTPTALAARK
jgi:hypothetical protein